MSTVIAVLGLLSLSSRVMAGSVTLVSAGLVGNQWDVEDDKDSINCGASAGFDGELNDEEERSGSVLLTLQYVGSATDKPPASVTLNYTANLSGSWVYYIAGSAMPKGSAKVSYDGVVRRLGIGPTYVASAPASVPQTTTGQTSSSAPAPTPVGGHVLPTPLSAWSYTDSGAVRTYTLSAIIVTISGDATADCDARGVYNYASAGWTYEIDLSDLSVSP